MSASSSSSSSSADGERRARRRRPRHRRRNVNQIAYLSIVKLMHELLADNDTFETCFGVTKEGFIRLQNMFTDEITSRLADFANIRPIRSRDRLAICLRFLASGIAFAVLGKEYNLQVSVIETIVKEVCNIIVQHLKPLVMPRPTESMWENIAGDFRTIYDMPNCVGSLNGRYITIEDSKPFVFLALVDANYKFIMIDFGNYAGDPQSIWYHSDMSKRFDGDELYIPLRRTVGNYPVPLPFVIVGGTSFRPKSYLLRKFRETDHELEDVHKVYNCRILPVKGVADEALTLLRRRWQVIQTQFPLPAALAKRLVTAVCCLHNYFTVPIM